MNSSIQTELRNVAVVAVVLAVVPILALESTYYQSVLSHLVLIALFAVALNIVFGHTDQLFLFTAGLAGIGAYGTALLADWIGVSAWMTLPVAALICGLLGLSVSWISAKRNLTVVLISILTLAIQLVLSEVFVGARDITGGSTGFEYEYFAIADIAKDLGVSSDLVLYYIVLVLLVLSLVLYLRLVHSKYGIAWDAIREDEVAAESIGINVVYYKISAGFVSGFLIGLVGAFYAAEAKYILPGSFTFHAVDVTILIVLIVGGLRTTLGPVVGAAIVVYVEEFLSIYAHEWQTAIFGGLLMFLFLYFRSGIVPAVRKKLIEQGLVSG